MRDVGLLISKLDIAFILNSNNIHFVRKKNKHGFELYFKCTTNKHVNDPDKLRMSIAESGRYKGMFNCWACGFSGNVVQLLESLNGWSFIETVRYLEGKSGSSEVVGIDALKYRLLMNKPQRLPEKQLQSFELPSDYVILTDVESSYAAVARNWLRDERHITDESIRKYKIGWSRHSQIGYSIVIPIFFHGKISSIFYAQPFKGGLKRYPQGAPQGEILFNYDHCLELKQYIMVESILDAIKIDSVLNMPSIACFTNMISERQLELLRCFDRHGIMPDLDGARGWDLVERMLPITGKDVDLYLVPLGKDPGDCSEDELKLTVLNKVRYCDYESEYRSSLAQRKNNIVTSIRKL